MDSARLKASMKAIDDLLELLDTRDAEEAGRLKGHGVVPVKGSDEELDDDKLRDKGEDHEAGESDDGDLMSQLKEMAKSNSAAKGPLDLLMSDKKDEDDEDEYC